MNKKCPGNADVWNSYVTPAPAYPSWRHQTIGDSKTREGYPGSLKPQLFGDCLKSVISAILQEKLFTEVFFPCISGPLDSWFLARQPKSTSTELLFWGCGSWKRYWPQYSGRELQNICPDFLLFFFLMQVTIRYFSTNLWAAPVTTTALLIDQRPWSASTQRQELRLRTPRCCLWHGALGASSAPSAQPSAPRGPALEVSRFYSVTLGLSFAIFLHTSRFCVFPGEKGKSFFKLCRHRLAVGKHGECRREGTCCLDY